MPSTYTGLGIDKMATGENAGTWGTATNTNWQIIEQIAGGYLSKALNTTGATTLAVDDGAAGDGNEVGHRILNLTAALAGNVTVTIPLDVQQLYVIKNSTTEAYSVEFKYVTGSGSSVTWASGDRGTKIVYATANDATNPDIIDATTDYVTATSTTTLTNKTLTAPKFASGGFIADAGGDENLVFTEVSTPVNELRITNAATGSGPILAAISTSATDSNIDLNINPLGTGVLKSGTAAVKIAGKETIWVPASAMYGASTNGAEGAQVETTATRPDMKVLDFDAGTAEYAQFSVAMPKSWNEGTLTYQVYWSPSTTNTGNCIFGLQGVACADSDTIDVAYGTAIEVTDAGIGTVEDQQITSESSAMTVAGSPAAGEQSYFQLYRDAADGSDTFTGESRVLGVKLFYTTDAANDA